MFGFENELIEKKAPRALSNAFTALERMKSCCSRFELLADDAVGGRTRAVCHCCREQSAFSENRSAVRVGKRKNFLPVGIGLPTGIGTEKLYR